MTVKAILSHKPTDVVSIEPTATLAEAAKLLAKRRIGAVLVLGIEGRVAGILSERDIVRALAERGASVLDERVDQVMTRKVFTCNETDTVAHIMEQMTAQKFRHVPVVDEGRLVGIISIGDVVKYRLHEIENETNALREYILTA
jgi:CBS domain-containing protein